MTAEEQRAMDPTRRILRVFGVTVTNYEERTAKLLERANETPPGESQELLRLALEAIDLTEKMNARLRAMNAHVLDTQTRVLTELKAALEKAQS